MQTLTKKQIIDYHGKSFQVFMKTKKQTTAVAAAAARLQHNLATTTTLCRTVYLKMKIFAEKRKELRNKNPTLRFNGNVQLCGTTLLLAKNAWMLPLQV